MLMNVQVVNQEIGPPDSKQIIDQTCACFVVCCGMTDAEYVAFRGPSVRDGAMTVTVVTLSGTVTSGG